MLCSFTVRVLCSAYIHCVWFLFVVLLFCVCTGGWGKRETHFMTPLGHLPARATCTAVSGWHNRLDQSNRFPTPFLAVVFLLTLSSLALQVQSIMEKSLYNDSAVQKQVLNLYDQLYQSYVLRNTSMLDPVLVHHESETGGDMLNELWIIAVDNLETVIAVSRQKEWEKRKERGRGGEGKGRGGRRGREGRGKGEGGEGKGRGGEREGRGKGGEGKGRGGEGKEGRGGGKRKVREGRGGKRRGREKEGKRRGEGGEGRGEGGKGRGRERKGQGEGGEGEGGKVEGKVEGKVGGRHERGGGIYIFSCVISLFSILLFLALLFSLLQLLFSLRFSALYGLSYQTTSPWPSLFSTPSSSYC